MRRPPTAQVTARRSIFRRIRPCARCPRVAAVFAEGRGRHRAKKVEPGDDHPLRPYRWWQLFSRSLFHLRLAEDGGRRSDWSVDVRLWGDSDGEVRARLYRDGLHHSTSKLPAAFPVPRGFIEVAASGYGLRRCHHVSDDESARQLSPDPASAEGRRARLDRTRPGLSRAIGALSWLVLAVSLLLGIPQIVEQVTLVPWVAENLGTFASPIHLPAWLNVSLVVASLLASTERALRLRYHWLLDGGLFDGEE